MEASSRAATVAAIVAFAIGLLESGVISEGVVLSIEDLLHLGSGAHIAGAVVAGLASLGFAVFAARRAYRFNSQRPSPAPSTSEAET